MITLNTFGVVMLVIAIVSIVINLIQLQKQLQVKKETLTPIYNGLIGKKGTAPIIIERLSCCMQAFGMPPTSRVVAIGFPHHPT